MITLSQEIESKYEVLQKMGEGGMGAVYKVRHRFLDDVQVIKLMQAKFQENAELKTRFLREAKTAKQLRHPNIAEVIDFNLTADGTAYIVMEFIEGVNLGEVLVRTQGPLDYRLVVLMARQALTALSFLHRKKFVHRDISPDNLMLTRDAEGEVLVKLIDLGITKSIEETRNLTMAGRFIGKVLYASPEQFGGEVDRRSDLYSFGIVLYELLTGIKPIGGADYFSIITSHMTRPPRPFEETDPKGRVPLVLRHAVMKALEKDPAARFQTADEFSEALKDIDVGNFDATVEVLLPAAVASLPGEGDDAMERADWDAASASDTMKAWESYVDRHGSSSRAGRARARLEQLEQAEEVDWNTASRSESSDAWRRYLDKHANSPRAAMARRRLEKMHAAEMEERAWTDAVAANSASAWDLFIAVHPGSPHIEEARQQLAAARGRAEEDRAWRGAETSDSTGDWRHYLETYPESARAEDARSRLRVAEERREELLAWERAAASDSSDAWRAFIREHARSARTSEANANLTQALEREAAEKRAEDARRQQRLEQGAWEKAVQQSSADGWESFVHDYPRSDRLGQAMKRLAEIRENERKAAERERKRAAEDEAWTSARSMRTTGEIRAFLEEYPKSRHAADAKSLLGLLAEEKLMAEQRAEEKRAEEALAEERRVQKERAEAQREEERSAQQKREEEARAEKRAAEQREEERRAEEKRAEEMRAEEKRAAARRAEKKRAEEKLAEEKQAKERKEEERRAEKKRADELRAEAVRTEAARAEAVRAEAARAEAVRAEAARAEAVRAEAVRAEAVRAEAVRAEAVRAEAARVEQRRRADAQREMDSTQREVPIPQAPPIPVVPPEVVPHAPLAGPATASRMFGRPAALGGVVLLIIAITVVVMMMTGRDDTTQDTTTTEIVDTQSTAATVATPGELVIHAAPWGEVRSVKDAGGKEHLSGKPVYTPVMLTLPAGKYQVELANPNSGRTKTVSAMVAAGGRARCEAELDSVDANEYLRRVLEPGR